MQSVLVLTEKKIIYFFCFAICISLLDTIIPGIRYIKYAILLIAIGLASNKINAFNFQSRSRFLLLYVFYAIWGCLVSVFFNFKLDPLGINDALFVLSYALPLYLYGGGRVNLYKIFWLYTLFFVISTSGLEVKSFSLIDSQAPLESTACFVFCAFLLYFVFERKKWYVLFAICMVLLTLKRIAFVAVFISLVIYATPRGVLRLLISKYSFLLISSIWVIIVFSLVAGFFDEIIYDVTGVNVHHFTMGRFSLYSGVVEESLLNPLYLVLGNGIGESYSLVLRHFESDGMENLHSDTLKIFYENGIVFFAIFFTSFGFVKRFKSRIVLFYLTVIFFTDNVLIYQHVMFFILLIVMQLERDEPGVKLKL